MAETFRSCMRACRWALQRRLCGITLASCEGTCAPRCSACSARQLPAAPQLPRPERMLTMQRFPCNLDPAMQHNSSQQLWGVLISPSQHWVAVPKAALLGSPLLPMPSSWAQQVSPCQLIDLRRKD